MFAHPDGTPIELPEPDGDVTSVLELLSGGSVDVLGQMPWSSNRTYLCIVREGETAVGAIYKPSAGERPLWDFPEGTLGKREVASFALSAALGWDFVPPTVYRDDAPLGAGSLQQFIPHDPNEQYFTLLPGNEEQFRVIAAFDIVANNTDRKAGHCLRRENSGGIVGIDHGLTFHPAWKLRTVIWDFAAEPLPDALAADIERVIPRLGDVLGPYLSALEVDATKLRAEGLLADRAFPEPGEDYRSYPWPLV